jgi:hypothetical protein
MFDDMRMPYSGFVDVRIWFENGKIAATMPSVDKPHYREYPGEYIPEERSGNDGP